MRSLMAAGTPPQRIVNHRAEVNRVAGISRNDRDWGGSTLIPTGWKPVAKEEAGWKPAMRDRTTCSIK